MAFNENLLHQNSYDELDTIITETASDGSSILAIDSQIKQLWTEMSALRDDATIKDEIKELELVRLIEVHNKLDIEEQRSLELYTKHFIDSLRLYELGIQPSIQGGVKCFIQSPSLQNKQRSLTRANTTGSMTPSYMNSNQSAMSQIDATRSGIVAQRKAEITKTLIELNRMNYLTPEDEQLKDSLMEELRSLQ